MLTIYTIFNRLPFYACSICLELQFDRRVGSPDHMNIDALKGGKKEQVPSGGNTPGNGD